MAVPRHGITSASSIADVQKAVADKKLTHVEAARIHPKFRLLLEKHIKGGGTVPSRTTEASNDDEETPRPKSNVASKYGDLRTQTAANKKLKEDRAALSAKVKANADAFAKKPFVGNVPEKRVLPKNHGLADPGRRAHAREAFELSRLENDLKILETNPNYNPPYYK